jgi:hypothetical protein
MTRQSQKTINASEEKLIAMQETFRTELPTLPENMVEHLARVASKTDRTKGEQEFIDIVYNNYYVPFSEETTEEQTETETATEEATEETKETATEAETATEEDKELETIIAEHDNFIPAYEVAKVWGLNPKKFWKKVYGMMRQDEIICYRNQETYRYTAAQLSYTDKQGLFYLEFPGYPTNDI